MNGWVAYSAIIIERPPEYRVAILGLNTLHNGQVVGATTSVAFGHTVGKILAFAYVSPPAAKPGTSLEVMIAGQVRAARVLGEPAYDPQSVRPRTDAKHQPHVGVAAQ